MSDENGRKGTELNLPLEVISMLIEYAGRGEAIVDALILGGRLLVEHLLFPIMVLRQYAMSVCCEYEAIHKTIDKLQVLQTMVSCLRFRSGLIKAIRWISSRIPYLKVV